MSKDDPVNEVRKARADYTNDALSEMGFGGVSDRKAAKANTQQSGERLDAVEDRYGIGKAKGPSAASRIGKAFRNFGSRVSAIFSPAAAPPQVAPAHVAPDSDRTSQLRADIDAKSAASTRTEALDKARTMTQEHTNSTRSKGLGR